MRGCVTLAQLIHAESAEVGAEIAPIARPAEARGVAQRSIRRTFKDLDIVDGEEHCARARVSTRNAVLRALAILRVLRVNLLREDVEATPACAERNVGMRRSFDVARTERRILSPGPPPFGECRNFPR